MDKTHIKVIIHPELSDKHYNVQRFVLISQAGSWQLIPVALADLTCQTITDITKIAEILNSPNIEIQSTLSHLKLTKRINQLICEQNVRNESTRSSAGGALLLAIPYVKGCLQWMTPIISYPHHFTRKMIQSCITSYTDYPETLTRGDVEAIIQHTQDLMCFCLCTPAELTRLQENLKSLQWIVSFSDQQQALSSIPSCAALRNRCREITKEIEAAEAATYKPNQAFWTSRKTILAQREKALMDEKFKEMVTAEKYQGLDEVEIRCNIRKESRGDYAPMSITVDKELSARFEAELSALNLNEETRKKYDPVEIGCITQTTEKLKNAYRKHLNSIIEISARYILNVVKVEDFTLIEAYIDKLLSIPQIDSIQERLTSIRLLLGLKRRLQNIEEYYKHSTSATIEMQRDQALQHVREFLIRRKELFPRDPEDEFIEWSEKCIAQIKQCYEDTLKQKKAAYLFASQFNGEEFPDLLDSEPTLNDAIRLAEATFRKLLLSDKERAFLKAEEVQFVEDRSKLCEEVYIDWIIGHFAVHARQYVHTEIANLLKTYLLTHHHLPAERRQRIKAIVDVYIPTIEALVNLTKVLYEGSTFKQVGLSELYYNLLDYDLLIQKLQKLHSEQFPDDLNPWEQALTQVRTQYQHYLEEERDAEQLSIALKLKTRSTPLFSEYPVDKSLAELMNVFTVYAEWMNTLHLPMDRFDAVLVDSLQCILSDLETAYSRWVDQCIAHHRQKPFNRDQIDIEELNLFSSIIAFRIDNKSQEALSEVLFEKLRPIFERHVSSYRTFDGYGMQYEQLVEAWMMKKLASLQLRLVPLKELDTRTVNHRDDRNIYFYFDKNHCLVLQYFHPVTGVPENYTVFSLHIEAWFQKRMRLIEMAHDISEWEHTPKSERIVFRSAGAMPVKNDLAEQFVVVFMPGHDEFLVVFNKSRKLSYINVIDRIFKRSESDCRFISISSLKQFEEVRARILEQEEIETLDQEFCLSEKALKTLSAASVLDLPKMPADLVRSSLSYFLEILRTINFSNHADKNSRSPFFEGQDLRVMIKRLIRTVKGRSEYSGIPKKDPMKKKWYDRFEALLRHTVLIMRDRYEASPVDRKTEILSDHQSIVLEIGKFVQFCGARWITELITIYRMASGSIDTLFVGDMPTILHKIIDDLKTATLGEMANETPSTVEYQSSHGLIYYMQCLMGLKYALPEAELADYEDTYDALGKRGRYKTAQDVEIGFKTRLKASAGIGLIHTTLNDRMLTESRDNILIALRSCIKTPPAGLERLHKEQAGELKTVQKQLESECGLTEDEKRLLLELSTLKRNAFIIGQTTEMKAFRTQIINLIANKPSHVLALAKELDDREFEAQKAKEAPLTDEEIMFLKSQHPLKTISAENKSKLAALAERMPCQLEIHECGGQEIYAKIGKEPYCRPDLIRRFGLNVIPFKTQLNALKEQHASQIAELLDEELLKQGLLRKETRMLKKSKSSELVPQEVLLLTVAGTLELLRPTGLLDKRR